MTNKEGNIISFKVFIDRKGTLMTEFSQLPIEQIATVFDKHDAPFIKKILTEAESRLSSLHEHLEKELSALH
mgnify:FL=1|tara:strand:+ start:85 stop:300 length:216 start_codon:yes stop_codon:yes gene_type:complete